VRFLRCIALVATTAALAACAAQPAPDHLGGPRHKGDGNVVVAESRYGHGSVAGPVRQSTNGQLQVRLPGGSWIDCGRSCADTLRRESIDFWENHGRDGQDGPGYFTWRR
jgi:hypothetical protein